MRRLVALLCGLCALAPGAAGQGGGVRVSARLSAGVLRLGDTGTITIAVENARDARIVELPRVEGLQLGDPGERGLRDSTQIVNGRVYRQVLYLWTVPLRPLAEGDHEIPPFVLEADGQRYSTQPLHVTVVIDIQGEDLGFLEVLPSSTRVVEGQPFTIELLFGWDAASEVNYADLSLPWWGTLPGALELESPPLAPDAQPVSGIVVNREFEVAAEQIEPRRRAGRSFMTLRLRKSFLPTRTGTLEFPTSFFEFGRRARSLSLFDTRPARRESHFVQAPPFTLEVLALPSEGQPLDYSGAVGKISARASADVRDVREGDSIKLSVEWSGQGNLEFFRAPDPAALDAFRGFRVYGSTEEKGFERRKVTYDLAPLSSEVGEIPALPLSVFDPESGRYETVATEPIPIRVRPLERPAGASGEEGRRFERDIADIDPRPPLTGRPGAAGAPLDTFVLAALLGVPVLGLGARVLLRRRRADPGAPLERRRRKARRVLAAGLRRSGDPRAELELFLEYLAARTREGRAAWIGRDPLLWSRANGAALPAEARTRLAALLARLEAAAYGGGAAPGREELLAEAARLEREGL